MPRILQGALALALALVSATSAWPAEYEVRMLNKGANGVMVFEPAFVRLEAGDTVRFVPTDRGHNAETIKGMIPEGVEGFKGALNQEVVATFPNDGVYGVKCLPHYGLGMVALIVVGDPGDTEAARAVKHPGKAKAAFADLFARIVAAD